ncbi:MAG: CPBP family intramembrane glutamic endopeptidase [Pseudomonadota bacterium]
MTLVPPLPFLLLAACIVAVWLPPLRWRGRAWPAWPLLMAAAAVTGWAGGWIGPIGIAATAMLAALLWAAHHLALSAWRGACTLAAALLVLALALHAVPGFVPWVPVARAQLSADAQPLRLALHADAALAAALAVAAWGRRVSGWREAAMVLRQALPVAAATTTLVLLLAWAMGVVRPDALWQPAVPDWAALHLLRMGLVTCVLEEAFFRGLIQQRLATRLAHRRGGTAMAVAAASLLFGLAHAPGGAAYMLLAMLAGVGYGWALQRTGRIEAAIAAHFVLNATHFIGFSYPRLA